MALARINAIRRLNRAFGPLQLPSIFRCYPSYLNPDAGAWFSDHRLNEFCRPSIMNSSSTVSGILGQNASGSLLWYSVKVTELTVHGARLMSSMKTPAPAGARKASLRVTLVSPGIVYEPYAPREPIPFWKRWFTPSGWRRTKEDIILEMKSAYAINKLRKVTGYSKKVFYQHAIKLYKEINTLVANGDISSLRKLVTDKMYSTLKNELKRREATWSSVYWELVEPVVSIRTLRARMIGIDKNDLDKAFIQLTLEFTTKQKMVEGSTYCKQLTWENVLGQDVEQMYFES